MKLLLVLVLLFASGCNWLDNSETKGGETLGDKAKSESKQAIRAIEDYAYAERAEFIEKMSKELTDLETSLNELGAKAEAATGQAKIDANAALLTMRGKWAVAKKQLDLAQNASEESWSEAKAGFAQSLADLQHSLEK